MAVVLTVEGLRDHARAFTATRLAAELWQLPAVKAWLDSEKYRQFQQSRARIEALLGANLTDLRDELLGDAVVLALRLPSESPADASQARGLLLFQARDKALPERLIRVVNAGQEESGELAHVAQRQRSGTTYYVREFPPAAGRLTESYAAYPDGTFAFSNAETMIHAVIDRKVRARSAQNPLRDRGTAGASAKNELVTKTDPGVGDLPKFKGVQRRLPETALARLFVDPRHVERWLAAAPRPEKASDARMMAMLERYVAAVDYAGAALVLSEGRIVVHTVETLDRSKLDPWLVRWAGDGRRAQPTLRRVPRTALALGSVHGNAVAILRCADADRAPRRAAQAGQYRDRSDRAAPRSGPAYPHPATPWARCPRLSGLTFGIGAAGPRQSWIARWFDVALPGRDGHQPGGRRPKSVIAIGRCTQETDTRESPRTTVAAALENALRTVLAVSAMDEKRNQGRSRITTEVVADATVTTLDFPFPFAYAVDRRGSRLILGTSAGAVARYLEAASDTNAGERFRRFQAAAFPGDETFFCVDLDALIRLAGRHRQRVVQTLAARKNRPAGDVDRDLTQVLALARLFEAAFVTSRLDPDATAVHRSAGLILHEQGGK